MEHDAVIARPSEQRFTDWITLNVGGTIYSTTRATLTTREPLSMLARMFTRDEPGTSEGSIRWCSKRDTDGAYLIDRSGHYFEPILNYLRHGKLVVDTNLDLHGVLQEAQFYGLPALCREIELKIMQIPTEDAPLRRSDLMRILAQTPYTSNEQLRFQGLNFEGCDLSMLDLRNVNFKYANLSNANLTKTNLNSSDMQRCTLTNAKLDEAVLWGTKLTCANLDKASMHSCNFEDPSGAQTNLEGASLKQANLESSQLVGVNLRVASLKGAVLRNCDLRQAVLAGANLEDCDLTGSDLQEANLRGANFTNAIFDQMRTPLHMSQTLS